MYETANDWSVGQSVPRNELCIDCSPTKGEGAKDPPVGRLANKARTRTLTAIRASSTWHYRSQYTEKYKWPSKDDGESSPGLRRRLPLCFSSAACVVTGLLGGLGNTGDSQQVPQLTYRFLAGCPA